VIGLSKGGRRVPLPDHHPRWRADGIKTQSQKKMSKKLIEPNPREWQRENHQKEGMKREVFFSLREELARMTD